MFQFEKLLFNMKLNSRKVEYYDCSHSPRIMLKLVDANENVQATKVFQDLVEYLAWFNAALDETFSSNAQCLKSIIEALELAEATRQFEKEQ